jgi:hypothetical protein
LCSRASYPPEGVFRRRSQQVEDLVQLIDIVSTFEDGTSSQELGQDAPYGPHVDARGIVGETQHDLGSSVPPRGDVFGHQPRLTRLGASSCLETSCETEITDLQVQRSY